jgi:hypothetical protein
MLYIAVRGGGIYSADRFALARWDTTRINTARS